MITDMGLNLPREDDFYNIKNFNDNFSCVEREIMRFTGDLNDAASNILGIGQKVDIINNTLPNSIAAVDQKATATDERVTDINTNLTNSISAIDHRDTVLIQNLMSEFDNLNTRLSSLANRFNVATSVSFVQVPFRGLRGITTTGSNVALKVVTINGFVLEDGVVFGVNFAPSNNTNSPTLNVNSTGAKPMWNDNGRIGVGNQVLVGDIYQIFQYNEALDRYIWITSMAI
jgi:hypothetical protein